MTDKDRERSYEHYKQWQSNKVRYEHECVAYVIIFGMGLLFVIKYWQGIIMMIGIALIIGAIVPLLNIFKKWYNMRRGIKKLENILIDAGAKNIKVDYKNRHINFNYTPQFTEEKLLEFKNDMSKMGLKMKIIRTKKKAINGDTIKSEDTMNSNDKKINSLKSTEVGYINKNRQKNLRKTDKPGTDNNQYLYEMECLDCGHKYYANGTDIWQRKCPKCQGGK